jgi:hypothetical protein
MCRAQAQTQAEIAMNLQEQLDAQKTFLMVG